MAFDLITVAIFNTPSAEFTQSLRVKGLPATHADGFDLHTYPDDASLQRILVEVRPHVILTFGPPERFRALMSAPLEVRKRWLSVDSPSPDPAAIASQIVECFVLNATHERFPEHPLVSVFTPTYKTGDKIERPFRSLQAQTYTNWEWVLLDDSPDDGATFAQLRGLARADARISAFQPDRPCGIIGAVKRRCAGLCRGWLLVELDHDDELSPEALQHLVAAAAKFPDAGFFYSDCAEVFENGENARYPEGWGFGFGSYREEFHNGRTLLVSNYPDINAKTIRHIVGVPNHFRAWRRPAYWAAGGHSPEVHVADDYEFLVRTFLTTRMCHIRKLGYIQYHNNQTSGNTQRGRNKEIQRLTDAFMGRYNELIHQRLEQLGIFDFIWREGGRLDWNSPNPRNAPFANLEYP